MNDERLARRAAKGDRRAFEAIFRRYHQELYRFCLATAGDPQDAQDALQNTMVKALRALPGEERQIKLRPWLYRIARNETIEIVRRRRQSAELDPEQVAAGPPLAETAASRQRLRLLLADLGELPERQRAALVMRELSGQGFEQIGQAFETSAAVARQTVYEARLSLRQMEAGREMRCEAVMRELSDADGRVTRRRELRAHLRDCAECRAFGEAIAARRGELAAIAPLPLALSAGLLQGALGGGAMTAAGGAAAGAGGGAVGGVGAGMATSAVAKTAATVAVVAAVGVGAADRGGLVDVPMPGGRDDAVPAKNAPAPGGPPVGVGAGAPPAADRRDGSRATNVTKPEDRQGRDGKKGRRSEVRRADDGERRHKASRAQSAPRGGGHGKAKRQGRPSGMPAASGRGQETAGRRKAPQARTSPPPSVPPGGKASPAGKGGAAPTSPPRPRSRAPQKSKDKFVSPLTKDPKPRFKSEGKHPTNARP